MKTMHFHYNYDNVNIYTVYIFYLYIYSVCPREYNASVPTLLQVEKLVLCPSKLSAPTLVQAGKLGSKWHIYCMSLKIQCSILLQVGDESQQPRFIFYSHVLENTMFLPYCRLGNYMQDTLSIYRILYAIGYTVLLSYMQRRLGRQDLRLICILYTHDDTVILPYCRLGSQDACHIYMYLTLYMPSKTVLTYLILGCW